MAMIALKKSKKAYNKEKSYNTLTNQKIMDRNYDMFLTFWKLNEYYETFS